MQNWILLVVIAQFLYAITSIVDKFIITSKKISKPFIYAFFVTALSILPLFLFLIGFLDLNIYGFKFPSFGNVTKPSIHLISMAFVSAYAGFQALVSLYSALRKSDASDVIPVIGSVAATVTLILSFFVLNDTLSPNFFGALVFLIFGTILISKLRFDKEVLFLTLHAGLLFGIKATVIKKMFEDTSFDQAFFWTRIALIIFVISLVLVPRYAGKIKLNTKKTSKKGGAWVLGNAILGGLAAYMTLKAIDLGNVALVQSMGSLQFIFLILISLIFGKKTPKEFGENNTTEENIQKVVSVMLIVFGFYLLFI